MSSNDYLVFLTSVQKYLFQIGGSILIILGSISCILSLAVFSQKHLRKNPCSIYFIACNVANLLYIYSSMLSSTLGNGYGIITTASNLAVCRTIFYMAFLFDILSPFYLILASIDRILITSSNALTRRRSTCRLAYICIISGTLFWMLFHSHTLIFSTILQVTSSYSVCYFQPGLYTVLLGYYSLLIKGLFVPILLAFFGIWTLRNIRKKRPGRIAPVLSTSGNMRVGGAYFVHPKDRQLILMLLIDIIIYLIFTGMLSVVVVYQQITSTTVKSTEQTQIDMFVRNIAVFITFVPFCVGCCGYLLVSKTFRNEVKKVLLCN